MKKFNYFLSIAFTFLFLTIPISAFTTNNTSNLHVEHVDNVAPFFTNGITSLYAFEDGYAKFEELQVATASSSNFIQDNLSFLYAICIALVLVNLAAQIKIIVQMIHLFFQFRKTDETIGINI